MTDLEQAETEQHENSSPEGVTFGDRYVLLEKLGAGGMGAVYKGYDKVLKKTVAVKVLLPNAQAEAMIRFHQEAKMAAKLSHANILSVFDFGQSADGDLYLIMDFIDGESLADLIKRDGPLDPEFAARIFLQICAGLEHAHSQGILHRDIKPSNIMLVPDVKGYLEVKIVDFGLAKVEGAEQSLTTTGVRVGSPLYMSPEQAKSRTIDYRSDIYSLGCLMYKTLTGQTPFYSDSFLDVLNKHVEEIPKGINEVSPDLEFPKELADIVAKALEKDPADRFQSAAELKSAIENLDPSTLKRALHTVPSEEDVPVAAPNARRPKKRIAYLTIAGVVVAIGVGLAATVSTMMSSSNETHAKLEKFDKEKEAIIANKLSFVTFKHKRWLRSTPDFSDADMRTLLPYRGQVAYLSLESSVVEGKNFALLKNFDLLGLDLTRTRVSNDSLIEVGKLTTLEILMLNTNDKIDDRGITHLQSLPNLNELHLRQTGITDKGLETISHISTLQIIDIDECDKITDKGIDYLLRLKNLKAVSAKSCDKISQTSIDRFTSATKNSIDIDWGDDNEHQCFQRMQAVKQDMDADPEFAKFFQNQKNWNRKNYDDVKNPRILKWVNDPKMQRYMRDPNIQKRFQNPKAWKHLSEMTTKFQGVLTDLNKLGDDNSLEPIDLKSLDRLDRLEINDDNFSGFHHDDDRPHHHEE